jgi:hypothetical protein
VGTTHDSEAAPRRTTVRGRARRGSVLQRALIAAVGLIALAALGVVANSEFGTATAEDTQLAGRPVPAELLPTVQTAALSCPALSPPRVAGQVMAASGFDGNPSGGPAGSGIAGLSAEQWEHWKPSVSAQRTDPKASIVALAHEMCDLSGQVRQAGIGADPWRFALGAHHSGVAEVLAAKGVPASAADYVDTVGRYAAWYATRPEFAATDATPSPVPSAPTSAGAPAAAKAVPDDYLPLVLAAGRTCPTLSPARIAAQLMAASAFNPNLLGAGGAQGIAGFTPQVWASYAARPPAESPWDPAAAIPELGRTMCRLLGEMSSLAEDPYPLAVAAFVWGPDAVKQAGGLPPSAELRAYVGLVQRYAQHYAGDPKLALPAAGTSPTTSAAPRTPSATPSASPKPDWQTRVVTGTAVLAPGQAWSTNRLAFTLRTDGEVALVDRGRTVWTAGTAGKGGTTLAFGEDGNLVLYNAAPAAVWSTGTAGNNGAILVLQGDGNVTISIGGRSLWHTGTED